MQRPTGFKQQRIAKWDALLNQMEIQYKSTENDEGISVKNLTEQLPGENKFESWSQKINDKGIHILNLQDKLTLKRRTEALCRSDSKRNKELKRKYTGNERVEDISTNNENMHNNIENNYTKTNRKCKRKIDDIGVMLMQAKVMKANDFQEPFKEKLKLNNNNAINIDDYEDVSSGYISESTSGSSSCTSDINTNNNMELILNIIDKVAKQNRPHDNILTIRKLRVLNINSTISKLEKKCINFYRSEIQFKISESLMFNLVRFMSKEENKNIQKYILGMELYRSLNYADCVKFNYLQSQLSHTITNFLKYNDVKILKIFVDYILCTFNCRVNKTEF